MFAKETSSPAVRRSWRYRVIRVALVLVSAVVLILASDLAWTLLSADRCFRMVETFSPGKTTLPEVQALLHYRPFVDESSPCSSQNCEIGFSFEERLSWWGLIRPRRGFQGFVLVRNGSVQTIHFFYAEDIRMPVSVMEGPKDPDPARQGLPVGLSIGTRDPQWHETVARVKDFADLPLDYRHKVLHPNVWCLIRIGGCQSVRDILPGSSSLTFEERH